MNSLLHGPAADDPRQRVRVSQTLLALGIYGLCAVVQHLEVMLGLLDETASWRLTAFNLAGGVGFWLVTRAGLNLRWGLTREFAIAQSLWAMVGISWSYGITGAARGSILLIMSLVVIFAVFTMRPAQTRRTAGLAIAMIGSVMLFKAVTDPGRYDPRVEAFHFLFFTIVMAACAVLSMRMGALRELLEQRNAALSAALERNETLATHDELTGLLNRRAAMERLTGQLRERRDGRARIGVVLIDLDHFKRVNDQHGHAAGDLVLRRFGEIARAGLRGGDMLARWGGEEFLLMLPGTDSATALQVLARMRDRMQATPLDEVAAGFTISFSAGVAVCEAAGDLEKAIERADAAMYAAKRAGRGRALAAGDCDTLAVC